MWKGSGSNCMVKNRTVLLAAVPEPCHGSSSVSTLISSAQYHMNDTSAMADAIPRRIVKNAGPGPSSAAVAAALGSPSAAQSGHGAEHKWKPTRRTIGMTAPEPRHMGVKPAHALAAQGITAAASRRMDPVAHDSNATPERPRPAKRLADKVPGEGADRGVYDPLAAMPKKGVVHDADGYNVRFRASVEGSLEGGMQRKRHINPTDLAVTRNGLGLSKPGDLQYGAIEYKPGFFKEPGVVAGSSSG